MIDRCPERIYMRGTYKLRFKPLHISVHDAYGSAMPAARTINLLGALAMGLAQEVETAAARRSKRGGLAPAGLCVIGHYPRLSIDDLRRVLGLSHPGAVRLVDRLTWDGLVKRRPAADGRAVALVLTRKGERQVDTILAERRRSLAFAVEGLTARERARLDTLLEKLLRALPRDLHHALSICRYCEVAVCERCPVGDSPSIAAAE
jgi:MarR family transcriptional regulator, negative regulator of the multidrug operon emrRAB